MTISKAGSSPSPNKRRYFAASNSDARWLIIGNPENRRVELFQQALHALRVLPAKYPGLPAAEVLAYRDLLQDSSLLPAALARAAGQPTILRIDSPGENWLVEKLLIERGVRESAQESLLLKNVERLRDDPGRIRYPAFWFAGYSAVLREIAGALVNQPHIRSLSKPAAIQTLFDKRTCHQLLQDHTVAVPRALPPVSCYDELLAAMQAHDLQRVFVKLASGSSSSGVVALSTTSGRPLAITSLELVRRRGEARFYNNLQLSRYNREADVRVICDYLCEEGAHVEEWLPKAQQSGRGFDLRVVTIGGRACHVVVRTSRSPITNLHLGNRRGDWPALKQAIGKHWKIVPELCEQAAACFPQMLTIGWDLLVAPGFRRACILEGNAFGDLLPNVLHRGESTYTATIRAALSQQPS